VSAGSVCCLRDAISSADAAEINAEINVTESGEHRGPESSATVGNGSWAESSAVPTETPIGGEGYDDDQTYSAYYPGDCNAAASLQQSRVFGGTGEAEEGTLCSSDDDNRGGGPPSGTQHEVPANV
jgi:hypothetical protein